MKMISNDITRKAIFILIPFAVVIALIIFFIFRGARVSVYPKEVSVDTTDDRRGLGYTGQRKIVLDTKGNIFVAYRKDFKKYSEIFVPRVFKEKDALQVTGTHDPISAVGKFNQRVPSIAVDSKGAIHVAWYGSDDQSNEENNRQIKYTRSTNRGETWSSWRNIAYVNGYQSEEDYWQEHPSLLVGKDDTLYLVWEGKNDQKDQQQIKFSKSVDGGNSWSDWKNVEEVKNNTQSRPVLIENGNGDLYLFMYSSEGNENDLQQIQYATSSNQGETWSPWQSISDSRFDARHVSATADGGGIIHAVWRSKTSENGPTQIIYRNFSDSRWSDSVVVSPSSQFQFFPSIGSGKNKDQESIFVTWMETADASSFPRDDPFGGKGFISFTEKGNFKKPITIGENAFYPSVPSTMAEITSVPVVYAEKADDKAFEIKIKFMDGS